MGIRRTREDKLQAKMRREEGEYSWKPSVEKPSKKPENTAKKVDSVDDVFFRKDLRRTFASVVIVVSLLTLAWWALT